MTLNGAHIIPDNDYDDDDGVQSSIDYSDMSENDQPIGNLFR
jgi:hypothetical protein